LTIVKEFYDAGISGTAAIRDRPQFTAMLDYMFGNGARVILVETVNRFARDLVVQLTGHDWLKEHGITIVPTDAPNLFTEETPTAILVRQVLGAVSEFAKTEAVMRMQRGRRKRIEETGWAGGPAPIDPRIKSLALGFRNEGLSLRAIAVELANLGHYNSNAKPYAPVQISRMVSG